MVFSIINYIKIFKHMVSAKMKSKTLLQIKQLSKNTESKVASSWHITVHPQGQQRKNNC